MTSWRAGIAGGILLLLSACASAPAPSPAIDASPAAPAAPPSPQRDESTAAAIEAVLASDHRSTDHRARDAWRHPADSLMFFGIRPDMTVVETWPAVDGWYSEVLAPLLAERGKLYMALMPPMPGNDYVTGVLGRFEARLASQPEIFGKVTVTHLGPDNFDISPAGSADLVLSFLNLHSWMNLGFAEAAIAGMHRALKPGGMVGVVEHRADPAKPADPRATNGYVNEQLTIRLFEAAGFELVARSEINANPRDTRDHEQGVWALPPAWRAGNRDRAKYEAIGESDRFTLKFVKK